MDMRWRILVLTASGRLNDFQKFVEEWYDVPLVGRGWQGNTERENFFGILRSKSMCLLNWKIMKRRSHLSLSAWARDLVVTQLTWKLKTLLRSKKKKEKRRKDHSRETAQRVDVNTDPLPVRVAPNAHHQALPPPRTPMVPMTKAEWERQQAQVKEVYDEESGRYRLVRGSGEIIERIVSRSSHDSINQAATRGDGSSFSRSIFETLKKK